MFVSSDCASVVLDCFSASLDDGDFLEVVVGCCRPMWTLDGFWGERGG